MPRYFFHLTDGDLLHTDQQGERLAHDMAAERVAAEKACNFMAEVGPSLDWSEWVVCIYDEAGSAAAVIPFGEAAPAEMAMAA